MAAKNRKRHQKKAKREAVLSTHSSAFAFGFLLCLLCAFAANLFDFEICVHLRNLQINSSLRNSIPAA
jgi:hypothetical protein